MYGVAEMPTALAIRAGLIIFKGGKSKKYQKHSTVLADPTFYEDHDGKVYCDAGKGIYAQVFEDRKAAIFQENPNVADVSSDKAKGELVEVVLFQYRNQSKTYGKQALSYLEGVIEQILIAVHDAKDEEEEKEEKEEDDTVLFECQTNVKRRLCQPLPGCMHR
jgi:hypothetical protein